MRLLVWATLFGVLVDAGGCGMLSPRRTRVVPAVSRLSVGLLTRSRGGFLFNLVTLLGKFGDAETVFTRRWSRAVPDRSSSRVTDVDRYQMRVTNVWCHVGNYATNMCQKGREGVQVWGTNTADIINKRRID